MTFALLGGLNTSWCVLLSGSSFSFSVCVRTLFNPLPAAACQDVPACFSLETQFCT